MCLMVPKIRINLVMSGCGFEATDCTTKNLYLWHNRRMTIKIQWSEGTGACFLCALQGLTGKYPRKLLFKSKVLEVTFYWFLFADPTPRPTCQPGFFTCLNGQCISYDLVCSGQPECPDGSDEMGCGVCSATFAVKSTEPLSGLVMKVSKTCSTCFL